MSESTAKLSPAGEARRGQMHDELIVAMKLLHRRRRVARRTAAAMALVLPILGATYAWMVGSPSSQSAVEAPQFQMVRMVSTDPAAVERYAASSSLADVIVVNDERLVMELAAIGRPAGIVRSEGKAWLTADVADARSQVPPGGAG